jgi:hypothetical protein
MNVATQRVRLEAIEHGHAVHRHGCFGEATPVPGKGYFCQACERLVSVADVISTFTDVAVHAHDLRVLLKALDDAEGRIAELEDGGRHGH